MALCVSAVNLGLLEAGGRQRQVVAARKTLEEGTRAGSMREHLRGKNGGARGATSVFFSMLPTVLAQRQI